MPVTMHPGQDVHLALARPLGELRAELAACTGRPELVHAPLYVDDRRLDDDHLVGHPPLLAGATLRTSPTPCPTPELALAAPVHLAVLTGPGAGDLLPLEVGPCVAAVGVRLRVRPGRRDGVRVAVRADAGRRTSVTSPSGRVRVLARGGGRPWVPRRWRRWRCGHLLTVRDPAPSSGTAPAVTVELRERPVLSEWTCATMLAALDGPRTPAPPDGVRPTTGMLVAALVPAIGSITLAIVLRNPLFAIMALTAPLMILAPVLSRRRQARGSRPPDTALDRSWNSPWGHADLRGGLPAADLLTAAAACAALPHLAPATGDAPGPAPGPGSPTRSWPGDLPDGCLAVVGTRVTAAALAARMVVSLHATGRGETMTVLCDPSRRAAWVWVRWLPQASLLTPSDLAHRPLEAGPGRLLVVDSGDLPALVPRLSAWHAGGPERSAMILLVDDAAAVPSWCSAQAQIEPDAGSWGARVVWSSPGTAVEVTPFDGISTGWAEDYARRVAALCRRGRWGHRGRWAHLPRGGQTEAAAAARASSVVSRADGADLPHRAALTDAPGVWEVGRRWRENAQGPREEPAGGDAGGDATGPRETLEARIGVGPGGVAVSIDLLRDGPHALVAGTTGSGKSELLQTLILTLALTRSPDELAVALVDFKGGASFGACARLPHVVGQVTDLDPGAAERALTGLQAELRRRERLFAAAGAADLATYRARRRDGGSDGSGGGEPLPRLLIVVDEFRAMADDHPDFIPGLVRIAAQGRSLGIHLVLATQRPGGAITADMRANIALRIALRVSSAADSRDVIDAPDAAEIPADRPGRAVVRRGSGAPETLQTYLAAGLPAVSGPGVWHSPDPAQGADPPTRAAAARSLTAPRAPAARTAHGRADAVAPGGPPPTDPATALVAHAGLVAARLGISPPRVPWSPALPTRLRWSDLPASVPGAPTVLLGLADHPHEQRHRPFGWEPAGGHLLLLGRAGSGRTSALRTLAHAAMTSGRTVHLVGSSDLTAGFDPSTPHLGTRTARADPRRVARLLSALASQASSRAVRHVVVVDGVEELLSTLGGLHRGDGLDLFLSALRDGPARGTVFALAGRVLPPSNLAALVRTRLVLASGDKHDDAYLGIPTPLAGLGGLPGRAVLVTGQEPLLCQVAQTEVPAPSRDREPDAGPAADPARIPAPDPALARFRVEDVAFPVRVAGARAPHPGLVLLGRGGDDAGLVWVTGTRNMLVCGPHGSGRTGALIQLLAPPSGTTDPGATVLGVISRDARLAGRARALDDVPTLERLTPAPAARFVAEVTARRQALSRLRPAGTLRLVVDDLDAFCLACPAAADALWALVEDDGPAQIALLAAATTVAAAGAFRGPLAELRAARFGVVLSPGVAGSSEVFGTDVGWHVEPGVHHPGRGALVDGSSSTFIQVADVS